MKRWLFILGGVCGVLLGLTLVAHRMGWISIPGLRQGFSPPQGWWTTEHGETNTLEALQMLGYLDGTEPPPPRVGVTTYVPERVESGLNLVIGGHAAMARFIDMQGKEVHRWEAGFEEVWPGRAVIPKTRTHLYWRRVHLRPDGGLYAIFSHYGLVRLDVNSRIVWATDGWSHHDLDVGEDGTIVTLCKTEGEINPAVDRKLPVLRDCVEWIDPETGNSLGKIDLIRALESSPYASLLQTPQETPDRLHANTVVILDGRLGAPFEKGRLLVSLRELDAVVVLDPATERVVWAKAGPWKRQHDPRPTDKNTLLVLDNQRTDTHSALIEIDPHTEKVVWEWQHESFHTRILGAVRRLPGGNTLVAESTRGRALEIAADGTIVWEWWNPERAGEQDEFIAALFDIERVTVTPDWLTDPDEPPVQPLPKIPGEGQATPFDPLVEPLEPDVPPPH